MLKVSWQGPARGIALVSCVLIAFGNVYVVTTNWAFDDMYAYLGAAERLLAGEPLYISNAATSQLYLYSPWFAVAWIPMTILPPLVVEALWLTVLAIGFAAALWPYRASLTGICLALLLGALLYRTLGWGNVQPLVVAVLVWSISTRAGPWVLGVVGSLKPLALVGVGVYLWHREWRKAAIAVGTSMVLWASALLFDLSGYPPARSINLYDSTLLLAVVPLLRPTAHKRSRIRADGQI